MTTPRTCKECDAALPADAHKGKEFCSKGCRNSWTNRRRDRGAELYDLFMRHRFERKESKDEKLWTIMCEMAKHWHDLDERDRPGRKSYGDHRKVLERNVAARAKATGLTGRWASDGLVR